MINSVIQNSISNYPFEKYSSKTSTEHSFSDVLFGALNSGEDDLLSAAPDKWLPEWTGESPVKKAVQFLKKMGIDAEDREPSHALTDEQKEWLRSRHDLDAIYNHTGTPLDEYNFRADLVYLGAMAPDEAENIGVWVVPTHCNASEMPRLLTKDNSDNYLDGLRNIMSRKKTLVDYFLEKYNDPRRRQDGDLSYIEAEQRLIGIHETYLSMMEDLFG